MFTISDLLASTGAAEAFKETFAIRGTPPTYFKLMEACTALATHRVSSAPVYDSAQGGFVGMFDYNDVLAYVLAVFHKVPRENQPKDADMEVHDIVKLALSQGHANVPVKLLSNLSSSNPLVVVQGSTPLSKAVHELVQSKVHRLVVLDDADHDKPTFTGILSQSTVATLIADRFGKLSSARRPGAEWPLGDTSVSELGLVQGDVYGVAPEDSVLDALYQMHEKHISSVAILKSTEHGRELYGSISLSDIKEILAKRGGWARLMQPCSNFFIQTRNDQAVENDGRDRVPSFTIHPTTSLLTAIEKMSATHSHRVWVTDPANHRGNVVVGVVSLSDVMPLLLK